MPEKGAVLGPWLGYRGFAGLSNTEISPKSSAGVSCEGHLGNWECGRAHQALSFSSASLGWDYSIAHLLLIQQAQCWNRAKGFNYSFYIAISVLASSG